MKHPKILASLLAASVIGATAVTTTAALPPHGNGVVIRDQLSNDPHYTFSNAYRQSVWYQNFTALAFSGNTRNDILAIALSQLGYHGGPTGDYSGTYNGSGTSDAYKCTEYGRLVINRYNNNYNNNAFDWCACFVNWCLSQARVDYASGELGCWRWAQIFKNMGMFANSAAYRGTYAPRPADLIFFNWDGNNTCSGHVGFVLYTTADSVYTVEGNSGNQVKVRSYKLNDPRIIGYGTPPYDEGDVPTTDHAYRDGMPLGEYVLGVNGQKLMKTPGGSTAISGAVTIPIGSSVTLLWVGEDSALVRYGGKQGYIPKKHLYLLIDLTEPERETETESETSIETEHESISDFEIESDTESIRETGVPTETGDEAEADTDVAYDAIEVGVPDTENRSAEAPPLATADAGCTALVGIPALFLTVGGSVLLLKRKKH